MINQSPLLLKFHKRWDIATMIIRSVTFTSYVAYPSETCSKEGPCVPRVEKEPSRRG